MKKAILRIQCPDRKGLVYKITGFIMGHNGNILELEQFVDQGANEFFMRIVWDMSDFQIPFGDFDSAFSKIRNELSATYWINDSDKRDRMALFVSRELHCLAEVLLQWSIGNLSVEIPIIISNCENAGDFAGKFGVEFIYTQTEGLERKEVEKTQLDHLSRYNVDFIGLARYMRILTGDFVNRYADRIINIHHSFLPAFVGASPYKQAYDRGVKIIGATSHFVTEELDKGAIIAQDTKAVHHGYSIDLLRKVGQEIEKRVFLQALQKYIERKIIRNKNRTIVFE